jgi:hypothetical protein
MYTAVLFEPNAIRKACVIFLSNFNFTDSNIISGLIMTPQLGRN